MAEKYFGWIGNGGYKSVVVIKDQSEAHVFNIPKKKWVRNDEFMKAMWDPGSDFEEISKEEADKIIEKVKG